MTDNERRRIFGLSKQLGINTEELHLIIHGVTGCESIKELDKAQTYEVIKELNTRLGDAPRPKKRQTKRTVPGMITVSQQSYCWSACPSWNRERRQRASECAGLSKRYWALRQFPRIRSSG